MEPAVAAVIRLLRFFLLQEALATQWLLAQAAAQGVLAAHPASTQLFLHQEAGMV